MDLELKERVVLVTGASKGIGLACARSFRREGAKVIITGRDPDRLQAAVRQLEQEGIGEVARFVGNLAVAADRERLFAAHPSIDVLVNNAGAIPGGDLFGIGLDRWMDAWQLKVFGYIHLTQLYLQTMKQRGNGVILNIIGMAGREPRWDYVCGAAANAALIAFTHAVGARSVDWNVRVLGINPSSTRTDRIETLLRKKAQDTFGDEGRWHEALGDLPFGRLAEPHEIADLAVVLASPRGSYVSGTVVDVDGGHSSRG